MQYYRHFRQHRFPPGHFGTAFTTCEYSVPDPTTLFLRRAKGERRLSGMGRLLRSFFGYQHLLTIQHACPTLNGAAKECDRLRDTYNYHCKIHRWASSGYDQLSMIYILILVQIPTDNSRSDVRDQRRDVRSDGALLGLALRQESVPKDRHRDRVRSYYFRVHAYWTCSVLADGCVSYHSFGTHLTFNTFCHFIIQHLSSSGLLN